MIAPALLISAALFFGIAVTARADALVAEDYMVSAIDPGIELFVRNKHLPGTADHTGARTVLFIHGSTYSAPRRCRQHCQCCA
jgi:hypothetical protein